LNFYLGSIPWYSNIR